ncbi:MAG TPA: NEW3 domain-containing protein, partial [Terriglobia bacterium]|nr:NEW3 domain-containing protein [Terriglobia bacterium]
MKRFVAPALLLAALVIPPALTLGQSCSTTGSQNTVVLMVNLPNGSLPAGVTQASLQDVFFAAHTPGVSLDGFLREASYGRTSATGEVFGPFDLTGAYTSCTDVGGAILNDAIAAAVAAGVNFNNYTRLVLVFPDIFNCGWQGFAQVGGCSESTTSGTFNLSVSYLSAAYAEPRASGVQLATHEMGHNLGLWHSGTLGSAIASDVIGPLSSPGTETDLGDDWTTMSGQLGLYTAPQNAETLGWMTSSTNFQSVTSSGTYTIEPLETSLEGLEALKVQRGTGNTGYYLWIEYRQPLGDYDSTLMTQPFSGALIHYEDPAQVGGTAHSYLPNFTPSDTTGFSPALAAGETWTDPYTNLSISVVSATSSALTVSVNYGAAPCTPASPSVSVSPPDPSIYPGQSASYSVSLTNNDSSGCPADTINLSSAQPAAWSTSLSASALTLSPGQSATVTMGKGAPSGTSPGTYAVNLTAATATRSTSAAANATVIAAPSLTVTLSVSSSSYNRKSTVPITATVLSGGTRAPGATVTFSLTTPS